MDPCTLPTIPGHKVITIHCGTGLVMSTFIDEHWHGGDVLTKAVVAEDLLDIGAVEEFHSLEVGSDLFINERAA